jgi:hypothetical protein
VEKRIKPQPHIPCKYEALASHRHIYLDFDFLDPDVFKRLSLEAIWKFNKGTGLL